MRCPEIKKDNKNRILIIAAGLALLTVLGAPFWALPVAGAAAEIGVDASGDSIMSTNPDYADIIFGTDKATGDRTTATPPGEDVESYDQRYNFAPDWDVETYVWPARWAGHGKGAGFGPGGVRGTGPGAGYAPPGSAISPRPELGIPSRPAPIGPLPGSGSPPPRMGERPSFRPQPGAIPGSDARPTPGRPAGESYRPMPGRIPGDY